MKKLFMFAAVIIATMFGNMAYADDIDEGVAYRLLADQQRLSFQHQQQNELAHSQYAQIQEAKIAKLKEKLYKEQIAAAQAQGYRPAILPPMPSGNPEKQISQQPDQSTVTPQPEVDENGMTPEERKAEQEEQSKGATATPSYDPPVDPLNLKSGYRVYNQQPRYIQVSYGQPVQYVVAVPQRVMYAQPRVIYQPQYIARPMQAPQQHRIYAYR